MIRKLIKLSETHYVIVDDSEIKEGDYYLNLEPKNPTKGKIYKGLKFVLKNGYEGNGYKDNDYFKKYMRKITHSTQPDKGMENVNFISLSEVEELVNGYSVEKMADEFTLKRNVKRNITVDGNLATGYVYGFKAHQELVKNKNEEVIKLLANITEWSSFKEHPIGKQAQIALDLLLPKTEWDIEFDEQCKLKLK